MSNVPKKHCVKLEWPLILVNTHLFNASYHVTGQGLERINLLYEPVSGIEVFLSNKTKN